jgi:PAS domain S-box-containing protein
MLEPEIQQEKLKKKLEKAELKIRILEDMLEKNSRDLYLANIELEQRSKEQLFIANQNLEKALREVSDYKLALDQSAIVSIINIDGLTEYVNEQYCEISGYNQHEIIGQNMRLLDSGFHDKEFFDSIYNATNNGKIWRGEIKNKTKAGLFFWLDMNIIPFNDSNGKVERYITISIDITEKKQRELELERQNRELQQFVYIASHDLQEPVRTIDGFARLLSSNYGENLDDVAQKSLNFITEATTRLGNLIKGLLDYGRLGRNAERKTIDLNVLLQNVKDDLGALITESKAEITVQPLPIVNGFETELRLLFQNLITNAVKFRKTDSMPQISISYKREIGFWHFQVQDNGIGIDAAFHQKIFQIFQRLHASSTYEGLGLGLAHCRKIVEVHDGNIWVDSKLGEGSIFHFTISI